MHDIKRSFRYRLCKRLPLGVCAAEGGGARRVSIRVRFFVRLRRVVGAAQRKRTEKRAIVAPPQPVELLPHRLLVLLLVGLAAVPPPGAAENKVVVLGLEDAATLAVTAQPILYNLNALKRAASDSAVAAGQLPDPELAFGIGELPINTEDAFSLRRDSDTRLQISIMQEFPNSAKRRMRRAVLARDADRLGVTHVLNARTIQRDASLRWLDVWRAERLLHLMEAHVREADAQTQAAEITLRTGDTTQAEFLAARLTAERLRDEVSGAEQTVAHARNALSRWIGEAAFFSLPTRLPVMPPLPPLSTLIERVHRHPLTMEAGAEVQTARAGADLARTEYRPDWRVEFGYGYRSAFSEMVQLKLSVDLPLFRADRQDRSLAAALARQEAAASSVEDVVRRLEADTRLNHHDYERLVSRLETYDKILLPQGTARIEAALAGWRSGRDALREVLDARRARLELQIMRLGMQFELGSHFIELSWLGAYDAEEFPTGELR